MAVDKSEFTRTLGRVSQSSEHGSAADKLFPAVYEDLRAIAASWNQLPGRSLQPTAIVHEAYLRMVDQTCSGWRDRAHFLAVAATAMRHILVDHIRKMNAAKRGGGWTRITLSEADGRGADSTFDLLELDEAIRRLTALHPRQGRIVELKLFAAMKDDEIAEVVDVTRRTIHSDWRAAQAYLQAILFEKESW